VADALATNVDRSARNPNLLLWHRRLWLIDHGAALYRQHRGLHPDDAERPFPAIAEHVLLPRAGSIEAAHHRLAPRLPRELLQRVVDLVPPEWLVLAPASTMVQPSPVHTGLCTDPAATLDDLFDQLVAGTDHRDEPGIFDPWGAPPTGPGSHGGSRSG